MNISEMLCHHGRRRPNHSAIIFGEREVSYRALDIAVDACVDFLEETGVRKGSVVGNSLGDTPQHLTFLFAIARLGAINLPLDPRWTAGEKERVAEAFNAIVVLVDENGCELKSVAVRVIPPIFDVKQPKSRGRAIVNEPGLPLTLFLSSGTTGKPKGPLLTHDNMYARFLIYYVSLTLNEHDRFACTSPLFFSASRAFSMCILYAGGTVVLLPPPIRPLDLVGKINEYGCTSAFMVPTLIRRILAAHHEKCLCLPNLRVLLSTGAVLYAEERKDALNRLASNILVFYGATEGGGISVLTPKHPPEKANSAGAIIFSTDVRIVDANFNDAPDGAIGRICYRNASTATSFYNDPDASKITFHDGWCVPGDLGYIDKDGFVFITGREKDMIIRGGANVYPNEIEEILLSHPDIQEAAVVGVKSHEFGEEIAAFIVPRKHIASSELTTFCSMQLAPYKVPRFFQFVDEIPRTNVGKIDKEALRGTLVKHSSRKVLSTVRGTLGDR